MLKNNAGVFSSETKKIQCKYGLVMYLASTRDREMERLLLLTSIEGKTAFSS